jgi:CheY-like chemotaxis protein
MSKPILLVEDDENDVFFMRRAMNRAEVANPLQVTRDGQDALDYFQGKGNYTDRAQFPLPCLVLLDLKLPRVRGLEVLKWVREQPHLSGLPVVVLTSSAETRDIDVAYRTGANSYLVKPPSADRWMEMVKALAEFWLRHNTSSVGFSVTQDSK